MKALRRAAGGFTLIELLVVISIFVILLAIMVPIGKRLRESNRTSGCMSQMQRVGQALKVYFMDEQGVPPVAYSGGVVYRGAEFPGLQSLFRLDYLKNRSTLHCPNNKTDSAGKSMTTDSPEYYESYSGRDKTVKPSGNPPDVAALKQYKYMPYRQALSTGYPQDYLRQLTTPYRNGSGVEVAPVVSLTLAATAYTATDRSRELPPDDTVVTWCNYHADAYSVNHHGQYLVMFWDGSVRYMDRELLTSTVSPAEAWLTKPTDMAH